MKGKRKKAWSLILSAVMVISMLPSMAFAESGKPTEKVPAAVETFADMPDNWSTAALKSAVEKGLLSGYEENGKQLIKASAPLSRAEMAAVMSRMLELSDGADLAAVTDVSLNAWYAKDLAKAVQAGIFAKDTKLRPNDSITRQETMTVLARAYHLKENASAATSFSDVDQIASWAKGSVGAMAAAGYVSGSGGKINPKANVTRGEFAVMMDQISRNPLDQQTSGAAVSRYLLKNGRIVDGTGSEPYVGSVIINGDNIEKVTKDEVKDFEGTVIDCTGKLITPGLIDAHSHNDKYVDYTDPIKFYEGFLRQGITSFVAGNCGSSVFGYKNDANGRAQSNSMSTYGVNYYGTDVSFAALADWFDYLEGRTPFNIATLIGEGSVRGSVSGVHNQAPLTDAQRKEVEAILTQAMEDGAAGISLGLMYEPSRYATEDELLDCAKICAAYDKPLSAHVRALSHVSFDFPLDSAEGHILLAFDEVMNQCKKVGAKFQFSHAIFVGNTTFADVDPFLARIDAAQKEGHDVMFDIYSPTCGASSITVIAPAWLLALDADQMLTEENVKRIEAELSPLFPMVGFGYEDIRISKANCEELKPYEGMSVAEIAKKMNVSDAYAYIYCIAKSDRKASVLQYQYSNEEIIQRLAKRDDVLFMSDAWYMTDTKIQNPAYFGTFTEFLEWSRDGKTTSIQDTIRKMSGAAADRYDLPNVGYIKEGYQADIAVFDLAKVKNNMNDFSFSTGTANVFINGVLVLTDDKIDRTALSTMPGKPIRATVTKK